MIRVGTHSMFCIWEVNGEATEASASDSEIPVCAVFRAPQSLAPSPHIPTCKLWKNKTQKQMLTTWYLYQRRQGNKFQFLISGLTVSLGLPRWAGLSDRETCGQRQYLELQSKSTKWNDIWNSYIVLKGGLQPLCINNNTKLRVWTQCGLFLSLFGDFIICF